MDYSSLSNIHIITRLRGPIQTQKTKDSSNLSKDPLNTKSSSSSKKKPLNNASKNQSAKKESKPSKFISQLSDNTKYTIFTSNPPSNTLLVSNQPILGKSINEAFRTNKDLYDFTHSILKDTSLFEFDKIYNETNNLDSIYEDILKKCFNGLVQ